MGLFGYKIKIKGVKNMTAHETLKLKDKMQKLLNHASSAEKIGNQAEAEAFMKKLNALCLKHKISMASVDAHDPENLDESITSEMVDRVENGLPIQRKAQKWIWELARHIAKANNCHYLVQNGSNAIWFVGRDQDRRFAIYMFSYCYKTLLIDCQKEYDKTYNHFYSMGMQDQVKGFAASFKTGFVNAIGKRLREVKEEVRQTTDEETFALITTGQLVAVNEFMNTMRTGKANNLGGSSSHNEHGYASGKKAGSKVSLAKGSVTSGTPKQLKG
tara:strand:+ start:111 stop:929 length:819 start_codon:yes stop_codon:yes gene_type:complete